jgi:hypothetical protein
MKRLTNSGKTFSSLNVHLYEDPSSKTLDLQEIIRYLQDKFGKVLVDIRKPFIAAVSDDAIENLARKLAETKVRDPTNPDARFEPLPGEIDFERKLLRDPCLRLTGVLYDGFRLQAVLRDLLPEGEFNLGHAHIVFTNRLFGTFDEGDGRYHARVSIYSFPSLISTTGIVEAPAMPKEYYVIKRQYAALGGPIPLKELREKFRGRFIDYDDERLTEVMKGYVMQALFYHLTFDPFCDEITCKLHNDHWQEEVIESKLKPREREFCDRHQEMLDGVKRAFGESKHSC